MTKEQFEKSKKDVLNNNLYDGTCPIDWLDGGECSDFNWESCSVCKVFLKHVAIYYNALTGEL